MGSCSWRFYLMAGTEPRSMLTAAIIFFSCTLMGIVLGVFGGSIVDIIDYQFRIMGWFQEPAWGEYAGYEFAINLFYSFSYILPLLGLYVLFSTIYHRYGRDHDQLENEDDGYYSSSGGRV